MCYDQQFNILNLNLQLNKEDFGLTVFIDVVYSIDIVVPQLSESPALLQVKPKFAALGNLFIKRLSHTLYTPKQRQ